MKSEGHELFEKKIMGKYHLTVIDQILDDKTELREFGNKHRKISHTWQRLEMIRTFYGDVGWLQALIHIFLDYGFISERLAKGLISKKANKDLDVIPYPFVKKTATE